MTRICWETCRIRGCHPCMRSMPAFILMTKGNVIWHILLSVRSLVVIRLGIDCYPYSDRLLSVWGLVVIRKVVGCHPFWYKLPSERIVAVICMDDIAGIDDYKERRTGEV